MSRITNFINLSFAIMQTGRRIMSSKGNRTIAVVNSREQYEILSSSLRVAIDDINTVIKQGKIDVDGSNIPVEMFLGGDYKFLLMSMGLSGATSDYSCLWCKIHKLQMWDMTKDLDYYNTGDLKRNLEDMNEKKNKHKFCCIRPPLFTIELKGELHAKNK